VIVLLLGGVVGGVLATVLVVPLRRAALGRTGLVAAVGLLASVVLLGPTLAIEASETLRFRELGLTEAGVPRNQQPPFTEAFVADARSAVAASATWAVVTPVGRCDADELAYQWLAFRLHPARPDCDQPDVTFYYGGVPVPADADALVRGQDYVITR
jgi:hypothetical protein